MVVGSFFFSCVIKLIISINDTCVWGKIKLIIAREALEQLIFCKRHGIQCQGNVR
jgi:hypothetical protein